MSEQSRKASRKREGAVRRRGFLLNWALRDVKRERKRTILVVVLIGIPLLIGALISVIVASSIVPPHVQAQSTLGTKGQAQVRWDSLVDAHLYAADDAQHLSEISGHLGAAHQIIDYSIYRQQGLLPDQPWPYDLEIWDFSQPEIASLLDVIEGRFPAKAGEIIMDLSATQRVGLAVDEEFTLRVGKIELTHRLVGVLADRPGAQPGDISVKLAAQGQEPALIAELGQRSKMAIIISDTAVTPAEASALQESGYIPVTRSELLDSTDQFSDQGNNFTAIIAGVVALVVLEAALIVGPAFLIGSRSSIRQLAVVASNGATPRQLSRIMLLRGAVTGVIASAVAVSIGTVGGILVRHFLNRGGANALPVLQIPLWIIFGLAVVGVLVSILAAWMPARAAANLHVITALSGRQERKAPKRFMGIAGVVGVGLGFAVAITGATLNHSSLLAGGIVLTMLGIVLASGTIVQLLAKLAGRSKFTFRFTLRDAARNRTRTAAAVAAIIGATSALVGWGLYSEASESHGERTQTMEIAAGRGVLMQYPTQDQSLVTTAAEHEAMMRADHDELIEILDEIVPGVVLVETYALTPDRDAQVSTFQYYPPGDVWAQRPPDQECPGITGDYQQLSRGEIRDLQKDERCSRVFYNRGTWAYAGFSGAPGTWWAVVDDGTYAVATGLDAGSQAARILASGKSVVNDEFVLDTQGNFTLIMSSEDGTQSERELPGEFAPITAGFNGVILSIEAMEELGMERSLSQYLVIGDGEISDAQEAQISRAITDANFTYSFVLHKKHESDNKLLSLIVAFALTILTMAVAGISTSLALADARANMATLGAVGAEPNMRRKLAAAYGFVISGTGVVLGIAGGVAIGTVFVYSRQNQWHLPDLNWQVTVPWSLLVTVLIVVPALTSALLWLINGGKLPLVRRIE